MTDIPTIPDHAVLGTLCRHGHDHQDTGQSLRYAKTGECLECHRIRMKRWKSANADRVAAYDRWRYWNHREAILKRQKQSPATAEYQSRYRLEHKDQIAERKRSQRAAARALAAERRAIMAELKRAAGGDRHG